MMNLKVQCSVWLFFIVSFTNLHAQYSIESFSLKGDMKSWYDGQIGLENSVLMNGERIKMTRKSPVSHAYFNQDSWLLMDIEYCGQTFREVSALFNLEEDFVIIKSINGGNYPIKLTSAQVASFRVGQDHFVWVSEPIGFRAEGFYKLLYGGDDLSLICKVYKKLEIVSGIPTYVLNKEYFLKKEGEYQRIRSFALLKKYFPASKKEINVAKKEFGIKGRFENPNNEYKLGQLMEFCDNLPIK
jgi:hypothetical protein